MMRKLARNKLVVASLILGSAGLWAFARPTPSTHPTAATSNAPTLEARAPAPAMRLFGTMGKEETIAPGEEKVLFARDGAGTLTHMWFGGSWPGFADTRIRIYVDGESQPGIDMALFLGHGIGWGNDSAPWGTNRIGKTGRPSGVYNTYRIPFGKGVKVTASLAPSVREKQPFWWIVRGLTDYPLRLGGIALPASARMKLHRLEKITTTPLQEVTILDTQARGLLYAVTFEAISENFNYLEACLRAYPNGQKEPLWLSSGTEDYFLGTYYFNAGIYHTPVAGLTHGDPDRPGSSFRFSAYRFHEDDPIPFQNGLRLAWRDGEELAGRRFGDPKPTTLTSYVWTYEW